MGVRGNRGDRGRAPRHVQAPVVVVALVARPVMGGCQVQTDVAAGREVPLGVGRARRGGGRGSGPRVRVRVPRGVTLLSTEAYVSKGILL